MSTTGRSTGDTNGRTDGDAPGVTRSGAAHRVQVGPAPHARRYFLVKGLLDRTVAGMLLLLLCPLLALIAVLVKATSPGPVFFTQLRVGTRRVSADGSCWELRPFRMLKFRSMVASADETLHVQHIRRYTSRAIVPGGDAAFKLANDDRITPLGRLLRRSSLDELPQLINVLRGEMSLVGPRPVPLYEAEMYRPEHFARFAAPPGITGLWQVGGRGSVGFDEMIALDIQQVTRRSLRLETLILLRTLPAVFRAAGAS